MTNSRPNILFITADQWRGDCLGLAGHPVVKTPNADALAAGGTAFVNHYAAAAPCSPARAAMYTGLWQMNNRAVANGTPLDHRFDNMARAARRAGYTPTLFGYTDITADPRAHEPGDPALTTYEGVLPGFDVEQPLLGNAAPWKRFLREHGYGPEVFETPYLLAEEDGQRVPTRAAGFKADHSQTAYLTGRVMEWLDEQPDTTPWFAHLSLIHPHPPFVAPAPYNTMYDPSEGPDFATHSDDIALHPIMMALKNIPQVSDFVPGTKGPIADLSENDLRRIRAVYYGLISEVDTQMGRLFDHLKQLGMWDNTVIILTSDHGEMMGDHGLLGKGGFFEQSQHIPLIIRAPGMARGQLREEFTSAIDLFASMLDLWGIAPTNHINGQSLLPLLRNDEGAEGRDAIYWEFDFRDRMPMPAGADKHALAAQAHLLARLSKDAVQVRSPLVPDLLFDRSDRSVIRNVLDSTDHQALRLSEAEALIHERMSFNDQTLANLKVGSDGPKDRFDS